MDRKLRRSRLHEHRNVTRNEGKIRLSERLAGTTGWRERGEID